MVATSEQITDAALRLPDRERFELATAIWKSLGASDDVLADLTAFIRAQQLDSGRVAPRTHAEVFGRARTAVR